MSSYSDGATHFAELCSSGSADRPIVIDAHGPPIVLRAGQKYAIRMEYFEDSGGAVAQLLWAYAGQERQMIPKQQL